MSWAGALEKAERWIQTLPIPKKVRGEFINLDDFIETVPGTGGERTILLRAAKRILEKRGATVRFTDPTLPTDFE